MLSDLTLVSHWTSPHKHSCSQLLHRVSLFTKTYLSSVIGPQGFVTSSSWSIKHTENTHRHSLGFSGVSHFRNAASAFLATLGHQVNPITCESADSPALDLHSGSGAPSSSTTTGITVLPWAPFHWRLIRRDAHSASFSRACDKFPIWQVLNGQTSCSVIRWSFSSGTCVLRELMRL